MHHTCTNVALVVTLNLQVIFIWDEISNTDASASKKLIILCTGWVG